MISRRSVSSSGKSGDLDLERTHDPFKAFGGVRENSCRAGGRGLREL